MIPEPFKTQHTVISAGACDSDTAMEMLVELEKHFPTFPKAQFTFKLMSLSVGPWLLMLIQEDGVEDELIGCCRDDFSFKSVLIAAERLLRRWRANYDVTNGKGTI
jgi:hypothetical protein